MRRTALTLTAALLLFSAAAADNITIHADRRPARTVFAEVIRQSGKNFIYTPELLRDMTVTIDIRDASLEKTLRQMFDGTAVDFRIKGDNVMLFRRASHRHILSGFVREQETGEALAGVVITDPASGTRTTSNPMGFYSLSVPAGEVSVTAKYLGFNNYQSPRLDMDKDRQFDIILDPSSRILDEVVVTGSPNRALAIESASLGSLVVSRNAIQNTPVIFGEKDVIKTLQLEPGISAGVEGTAGMYVHGGNSDENLYMLDNIPLYQVNHFGGLFSAFNIEALRNVEFHKSTFPAKYDGRLSSFMDVNTKDGSMTAHHGSGRLGLTSGAFNIDGPVWRDHTSYSVALRRSWFDVLTIPACAIVNTFNDPGRNYSIAYAFTDLNAKLNHRFSDRSSAHLMLYYGDDYLKVRDSDGIGLEDLSYTDDHNTLRWGNFVASAGWNYVFSPKLFGELTAAYTRYQSKLESRYESGENDSDGNQYDATIDRTKTVNNINDWIFRADFDYRPLPSHRFNFGASYTIHSFLPSRSERWLTSADMAAYVSDHTPTYRAGELNAYAGGDWDAGAVRLNYGVHWSNFSIRGHNHGALSPRLSFRWNPLTGLAVKGGYSRTVQYVHQLIQSSISLPTDQWVPIVGDQKPQTADKIALGLYYDFRNQLTFSVEVYRKWMNNLLDFADEYYLIAPEASWDSKLTQGKGSAKGIDFKLSREFGKVTGHIAYSLLWADRRFDNINGGRPFPARFDNRHKINILLNWKINERWEVGAAWTGMSGNRITLPTQCWDDPEIGPWHYDMSLATDVNNFRLPFYHRLDLSARRHTRRGYWEFSLYNAYCNMNTIGVRRDYSDYFDWNSPSMSLIPRFQKIRLIPIIPSVSYTWIF
ncbi:MAG: TonB-dependent receptor [Clostridium sp.]|nr:TonB-dependent receptor [Clostridium sp.]